MKGKEKSCNKKRKKVGTHSIFKFNKMTFVLQNQHQQQNWNDSK